MIRCKDCRGAFHLGCMLVHRKDNDGEENEGSVDDALGVPARDPKRCYRCESKRKSRSPTSFLSLLEAIIDRKTVQVRVIPEPALEATANGKVIACYVAFGGRTNITNSNGDGGGGGKDTGRKRVT